MHFQIKPGKYINVALQKRRESKIETKDVNTNTSTF